MKQLIFSIVVFIIGLSSCQQFTVQEALLEGKPCSLPCWYDVVVGESSYDSVILTLETYFAPENISFPRNDSILVCQDGENCLAFMTLSADKDRIINQIIVGFETETVFCAELLEVYGIPDLLVDVPYEQSTIIFYDEAQIEIILVVPEVTPNRRWAEFMFIREESAYSTRKNALLGVGVTHLQESEYLEFYCSS